MDLHENMGQGRAFVTTRHRRVYDRDDKNGLFVFRDVGLDGEFLKDEFQRGDETVKCLDGVDRVWDPREGVWNLVTNVGRVQAHTQVYATSGLLTNGFNYIALTNDSTSPAASGTTLTSEIAANGLTRAQGTVTLASGSGNTTTVDKTFTCATSNQACQQTALFTASSSGVMNHWASFTQRSLIVTDTIQITFTITLG